MWRKHVQSIHFICLKKVGILGITMTIPAWNIESGFVIFGMVMVQTPFEMLFIYLER
jgi:hypothetical protein